MVLRNVQPTFTFEEQRVEINELAADVDSISVGYNNTNWDTAFSWGNHAAQNYIVNGTFSNVTINAGITTRNLTITDDGSASPIFVSRADDNSVWNLSLQNDGYSTNAGTGTKYFMNSDGTAKWYHYGYSEFENTEFYTARVVGSPSSYLAFRLDTFGGSQLLYQGNYRAGSTSWGLNVTGNLYASQGMDIPDGYGFQAGNSDDLRLYHNGSHSYIDNYTGTLYINNYSDDQDIILSTDNGSGGATTYLRCDGSSGAVILDHYGTEKLTTTSTGIEVSGTVVSDPTATNVAGYAFEVKNGATSLGGLYKTSSNGGFLQLNNGAGTLKASINGEVGSGYFASSVGVYGSSTANTSLTVSMDANSTNGLRIDSTVAGTDTGGAINVYNSSGTRTALIQANGSASFSSNVTVTNQLAVGAADATSATTLNLANNTSGGNNLVLIRAFANGGGDAYIKFDCGGSDMVVGNLYAGTTNNKLVLGSGTDPSNVVGLTVNGVGDCTAKNLTLTGQTNTSATGASATSDTFDHYEEGTFTPGIDVSGTSGTLAVSYVTQNGRYTRIGRMCFCTIDIRLQSFSRGTGTGGIMVTGLPFQPINSGNYSRSLGSLHLYNWTSGAGTAGDVAIATVKQDGTAGYIDIRLNRNGYADSDVSDPSNNSMLFLSIAYEVA